MSLNQTHSYNRKKTNKLGKYFSTIDFTINKNLTAETFIHNSKHSMVGEINIGSKSYEVNVHELQQLKSTIDRALEVIDKKYRIGLI